MRIMLPHEFLQACTNNCHTTALRVIHKYTEPHPHRLWTDDGVWDKAFKQCLKSHDDNTIPLALLAHPQLHLSHPDVLDGVVERGGELVKKYVHQVGTQLKMHVGIHWLVEKSCHPRVNPENTMMPWLLQSPVVHHHQAHQQLLVWQWLMHPDAPNAQSLQEDFTQRSTPQDVARFIITTFLCMIHPKDIQVVENIAIPDLNRSGASHDRANPLNVCHEKVLNQWFTRLKDQPVGFWQEVFDALKGFESTLSPSAKQALMEQPTVSWMDWLCTIEKIVLTEHVFMPPSSPVLRKL